MRLFNIIKNEFFSISIRLVDRQVRVHKVLSPVRVGFLLALINLNFWLMGSDYRVFRHPDCVDLYIAKSERRSYTFAQLGRSWGFLNDIERGFSLGKSYGIDEIAFSNESVFIDVGANIGDVTTYFNNIGYEKTNGIYYIGFEPGVLEFQCLERNVDNCPFKLSRVFNKAVSDLDGSQKLYYSPQYADSSLMEPPEFDKILDVEVVRLDSILAKLLKPGQIIDFLKCEAEGFELEVLVGLGSMLSQVRWIGADLGFERGLEQRATAPEVIPYLLERGFYLVKLTQPQCVRYLFRNSKI